MDKLSQKRLFLFWLPIFFLFSIIISIIFIFSVKSVAFIESAFSIGTGGIISTIFNTLLYAGEVSSEFNMIMVLSAFVFLLTAEVFLISRMVKIRKIEKSSVGKLVFRFLVAQIESALVAVVGFIFVYFLSLAIAFAFGYIDVTFHAKDAMKGVITNDDEIIRNIQSSNKLIDVYDAAGGAGTILAKRGLKKQDKLTMYDGIILPLLVNIVEKDKINRAYFVPETNSVVYINFEEGKTDKIIIELAFNHLKFSKDLQVAAAFQSISAPAVEYLDDDEFTPFVKKKSTEINDRLIRDLQGTIDINEKIVAECIDIDESNVKLVAEQESDYAKNCVSVQNYSNCTELADRIKENKKINSDSIEICSDNKAMLASQKKDMVALRADIEKSESSRLEDQKGEISVGMYFSDLQTVYMRVISDKDSFAYLYTLLHELLHHYSHAGANLPAFFYEGMTDYIALKSLDLSDYEIARNASYYRETQIIMALLERIEQEELEKVYFSDDKSAFEDLFKQHFPDVDYKDFVEKGDAIFQNTFKVTDVKESIWDVPVDNSMVQDVRTFLGLAQRKFVD